MAALTTTDQFLELLRKSRLIDPARLDSFLRHPPVALPAKPNQLADLLVKQGLLTRFQVAQLLAGKWRGFLVANNKYKLLGLLGVGGMGKVYLCEHLRMKRLVALKVLPTDKLEDKTSLERFEREARAAAALSHQNIVRAHDLDSDGELHFLVMEYVDGTSLQDVVKKFGPLDPVRACHYIAQAAEGLQHAHEAGWVHRDIKPGNLLLDRTGTIKILDMGLARFFSDDAEALTKKFDKSAVLGTADYLAPEQAKQSDVDIRADIYSLGATFYFLLAGRGPFESGTVTEKLLWHQMRTPDPVRSLRPEVPKEVEAVIKKMMAKKPVHRYQEPAAVIEALQPWTSQPIEPPADEEMPRLEPALAAYSSSGASLPTANVGPASTGRLRPARPGPRTGTHSRISVPRSAARLRGSRTALWVVGGTAAVAFLGIVTALLYWALTPEPTPRRPDPPGGLAVAPDVPPGGRPTPTVNPPGKAAQPDRPPPVSGVSLPAQSQDKLYVTRNPQLAAGRKDVLATLGEAVARARPGQQVLVLDEQLEENVEIDGQKLHALRVESGRPGGQPVTWRPAADASPDRPLVRLVNPVSIQVRGFVLDGGRRTDHLMVASGACGGLRLEDLYLTDAAKESLVLDGCAAPPGQAATLERLRFTTLQDYSVPANHTAEAIRPAALLCTASAGGPPSEPLNLVVRWCRFEGMFRACARFEVPVEAEVRLNRFYSLRADERPPEAKSIDAISVKVPQSGPVKMMIASNTMSRFTNLLHLNALPAAGGESRFVLRSNLVMGLMDDAWVFVDSKPSDDQARPFFPDSEGNLSRPNTVARGLGARVIPRKYHQFGYIDVSLGSDSFLRYKAEGDTKPLLTAGANGEPVGVPPL
jgi:serine/threonine protein kinase